MAVVLFKRFSFKNTTLTTTWKHIDLKCIKKSRRLRCPPVRMWECFFCRHWSTFLLFRFHFRNIEIQMSCMIATIRSTCLKCDKFGSTEFFSLFEHWLELQHLVFTGCHGWNAAFSLTLKTVLMPLPTSLFDWNKNINLKKFPPPFAQWKPNAIYIHLNKEKRLLARRVLCALWFSSKYKYIFTCVIVLPIFQV